MNWKLIFLLSLAGLAMSYLTVSILNMNMENIAWGVIILFYGYMVARYCNEKYFLNGFMISIVNCVWVTGVHLLFFNEYIANHAEMVKNMDLFHMNATQPKISMLLTGPVVGIVFGIVVGAVSWLFSKIVKKMPAGA
jgi:hypothetical protein